MATAKQRAWRAKFARLYGGGKKKRRRSKGGYVAKRRGRRYSRGGMNSIVKTVMIGTLAGVFAPKVPVLNTMPRFVSGAVGTYALGSKNLKNVAIGGAAAHFLSPMLGGAITKTTGTAW